MISTKESTKNTAELIRSLGHPARIQILILLNNNRKNKMTVTQIHELLTLTQPETSRHLSVLKNSTVLHCKKAGTNAYYFINEEHPIIRCIANFLSR